MSFNIVDRSVTLLPLLYKSGAAASCGATVMVVFNKNVSYKISLKADNERKYFRTVERNPPYTIFFQFHLNFQLTFQ